MSSASTAATFACPSSVTLSMAAMMLVETCGVRVATTSILGAVSAPVPRKNPRDASSDSPLYSGCDAHGLGPIFCSGWLGVVHDSANPSDSTCVLVPLNATSFPTNGCNSLSLSGSSVTSFQSSGSERSVTICFPSSNTPLIVSTGPKPSRPKNPP